MISQVRTERLSDKVVKQILSMVHDGEYKSGDKLPSETELAKLLGVSRGVLREAMQQLETQGYVTRKPHGGTVITENINNKFSRPFLDALEVATYLDLLDFREALEVKMMERVVERATDDEIEAIFDALDNPEAKSREEVDHYFHYILAKSSKNIFYVNFIDTYYDLIKEIKETNLLKKDRQAQTEKEHRAIAEAIARRDAKAAVEAMSYHMRMVRKTREEQI